jgi:hypothetical protein
MGAFASEISKRYGCLVVVFEPIFFDKIPKLQNVIVVDKAIGGKSGHALFNIRNDSTGMFQESEVSKIVSVIGIEDVLAGFPDRQIDLLKLNVEGMEFDILEAILEKGLAKRFVSIQVQFHSFIPDCESRLKSIREGLLKTHEMQWGKDWWFESWKLK